MTRQRKKNSMKIKKALFVESGGECAITKTSLVLEDSCIAEIAHIESYSPNGPRANPNNLKNNKRENLMIICPSIHKVIDDKDNEKNYPKEKLKDLKNKHIEDVKERQKKVKNELENEWLVKF